MGLQNDVKKKNVSETNQSPGKERNEIYDPEEFVESIVNGTRPDEVARSVLFKVQERFMELGQVEVWSNV
jgi:hypothetical protein